MMVPFRPNFSKSQTLVFSTHSQTSNYFSMFIFGRVLRGWVGAPPIRGISNASISKLGGPGVNSCHRCDFIGSPSSNTRYQALSTWYQILSTLSTWYQVLVTLHRRYRTLHRHYRTLHRRYRTLHRRCKDITRHVWTLHGRYADMMDTTGR